MRTVAVHVFRKPVIPLLIQQSDIKVQPECQGKRSSFEVWKKSAKDCCAKVYSAASDGGHSSSATEPYTAHMTSVDFSAPNNNTGNTVETIEYIGGKPVKDFSFFKIIIHLTALLAFINYDTAVVIR